MSTSLQNIDILLITHVVFNKNLPTAGPYSSVIKSLQNKARSLRVLEIPLYNFDETIIYGDPLSLSKLKISKFLGIVPPIKYVIDIIITIFFLLKFSNKGVNVVSHENWCPLTITKNHICLE